MRELMFIACAAIYFGIIGLLIYDTVDQIRGRRWNDRRIEKKAVHRRHHFSHR